VTQFLCHKCFFLLYFISSHSSLITFFWFATFKHKWTAKIESCWKSRHGRVDKLLIFWFIFSLHNHVWLCMYFVMDFTFYIIDLSHSYFPISNNKSKRWATLEVQNIVGNWFINNLHFAAWEALSMTIWTTFHTNHLQHNLFK
jgi:hypothetical protein